jgi:hypothetical protein
MTPHEANGLEERGVPPFSADPPKPPADEPLETPEDTMHQHRSAVRSGTDPGVLPRTQRMLIGLVVEGMKVRNMTQHELAELAGLSDPFVSQLLGGRRLGTLATWDKMLIVAGFDFNGLGGYKPLTEPGRRGGRKPKK